MASSTTALLLKQAEDRNKIIDKNIYRKEDKATRKCPKCQSPFWAIVGTDNDANVLEDGSQIIYCLTCRTGYDTPEIKIV